MRVITLFQHMVYGLLLNWGGGVGNGGSWELEKYTERRVGRETFISHFEK